MKKLMLLLLLCIAAKLQAQQTYTVSMTGMGPFKINMKKAELEKLLGTEITLKDILKEEWNFDTLSFNYNGAPFTFVFDKLFKDDKNYDVIVREITSSAPGLKTPSGIAIGDDKIKIINAYELYTIWIVPDYEKDYFTRSKTNTSIWVQGEESGNTIIFHLCMNKVASISVTWNENYD